MVSQSRYRIILGACCVATLLNMVLFDISFETSQQRSIQETTEIQSFIPYFKRKRIPSNAVTLISTDVELSSVVAPMKTILYWTTFFGSPDSRASSGNTLFHGCPVSHCTLTGNRNIVKSADAVYFHALDLDPTSLPEKRGEKQHYIFALGESPSNIAEIPQMPKGFFDMTQTYRLDSDVSGHYLYNTTLEKSPKNFAEGKTKLIAWFVSNCRTHSRREKYVRRLQKYVPVDIYGRCGNLPCPRSDEAACFEMLRKDYKFYLAFENSICKDYVTEKFTNALENIVLPIVIGAGNMSIFPPNSYIHVDSFRSAKALAKYLQYLDRNDTAYNEYMRWRFDPFYIASTGPFSFAHSGWCKLCERLHDPTYQAKEYPDAMQWFIETGHCRDGVW